MDPQLVRAVSNSKLGTEVIKRLWPTMLFPFVISILGFGAAYFWTSKIGNQINSIIAFWFWFIANIVITGFSIYGYYQDIRVYAAQSETKSAER